MEQHFEKRNLNEETSNGSEEALDLQNPFTYLPGYFRSSKKSHTASVIWGKFAGGCEPCYMDKGPTHRQICISGTAGIQASHSGEKEETRRPYGVKLPELQLCQLPYSSLGLVHSAFHQHPASTRLALREATPIINLGLSELAKIFHAPAHLLVGLSITILKSAQMNIISLPSSAGPQVVPLGSIS